MAWYDYDPQRVLLEQQIMADKFPGFQLTIVNGMLTWVGTLESNRGNRYKILVRYPDEFPNKAPEVYPINPVIEVRETQGKLKHQYPDGKLCLYYPGDRTFPPNSTAATVVAVAAAWFFAYESWLESGCQDWPGQEIEH